MNALEIIEQVRAHKAELVIENNTLIIRGRGERLPPELHDALRENKAAVMVALGATLDAAIASILVEIRPHLPAPLKRISDADLLVLVNWSMLHAWNKAVRSVQT